MQLAAGTSGAVQRDRMRIKDAAEFLGVTTNYMYKKCASGGIRHYKIGGKLQFAISDLRAHLESTKRGGE